MTEILMITLKYFEWLNHFEIEEIQVFVDIILSTFNFTNVSHGLSGAHFNKPSTVFAQRIRVTLPADRFDLLDMLAKSKGDAAINIDKYFNFAISKWYYN